MEGRWERMRKSKGNKSRLYHAVEVYTGMYKTAEIGLEPRARSARVSKISKVMHSRICRHGMV